MQSSNNPSEFFVLHPAVVGRTVPFVGGSSVGFLAYRKNDRTFSHLAHRKISPRHCNRLIGLICSY